MKDTSIDNKYRILRANRPELFVERPQGEYQIQPEGGEVCYEDSYVLVIRDPVITPAGSLGSYLRIISPPNRAPGAVILPVAADSVILLQHPRHALGRSVLEAPRGFGEVGEEAEACARRELMEELGCSALALHSLGNVYPDSGLLETRVALFAANVTECPLVTEVGVNAITLSIRAFEEAIREGAVEDGFTIAAFCRARLLGLL